MVVIDKNFQFLKNKDRHFPGGNKRNWVVNVDNSSHSVVSVTRMYWKNPRRNTCRRRFWKLSKNCLRHVARVNKRDVRSTGFCVLLQKKHQIITLAFSAQRHLQNSSRAFPLCAIYNVICIYYVAQYLHNVFDVRIAGICDHVQNEKHGTAVVVTLLVLRSNVISFEIGRYCVDMIINNSAKASRRPFDRVH